MSNYGRGARVERIWEKRLNDIGHLSTRAAGSGNRRNEMVYDIHSTDRSGRSFLWEVKSTRRAVKYFSGSEATRIKLLKKLAREYKANAYVVVRFKGRQPRFVIVKPEFVVRNRKISKNDQSILNPANLQKIDEKPISFVCPSCLSRYEFYRYQLEKITPTCDYCNVPLIRIEGDKEECV